MIRALKAWLKRYWPAISLRTILFGTLLFVAALPGVAALGLRVYENTLVQQTEAELIAQSAVLASAYRMAWGAPPAVREPAPEPPSIDLQSNPVLPPVPLPEGAGPSDPQAAKVARAISPIVDDAVAVTLSDTKLLDRQGIVVAGHYDLGFSYRDLPEVRRALQGHSATVLRRREVDNPYGLIHALSGAAGIRVHHVRPVIVDGKVVGMVMVARSPRGLFLGIWQDRYKIALGVAAIFMTLLLLAAILSRGIARPIRALAAASENVARGRIEIPEPPVTAAVEIRELFVNFARMAERIEARARYLRDFAAAVSHEFKTPLTGIRGAIELLDEHGAEMAPEERHRFLANAAADADRLSRLVQRLLDLARADMAEAEAHAHADPEAIARTLALELADASMSIHVEAPEGLREAHVLPEAIETVLVTLIGNSRQAGAKQVRISISSDVETVWVRVADDGSGIAGADRERIFEPFFTGNREKGGTGLGLPIARSLLATTGGTLILEEVPSGTSFCIEMPAEPG
ncbi:MAG: HAMP domain-containing histidine kinase [Sphingomonas sp.]|nr:HAMP domain-containing histidine kinase [Sphingomonas sp.]